MLLKQVVCVHESFFSKSTLSLDNCLMWAKLMCLASCLQSLNAPEHTQINAPNGSPRSIPSSQNCLCSSTSTLCDSWGWGLGSSQAGVEGWGGCSVVGRSQTLGRTLASSQSLGQTLDPCNTRFEVIRITT